MKKNNGFTLIEILAVVIILGVIAIIAVPSITNYVNNSRKEAYITIAQKYVEGALFAVKKHNFDMSDKTGTYYISHKCITLEKGGDSPFGEWEDAYVVVGFGEEDNSYEVYWTSLDKSGHGVDLTLVKDLNVDDIVTSIDEIKIESLPNREGNIFVLEKDENGKCSSSIR